MLLQEGKFAPGVCELLDGERESCLCLVVDSAWKWDCVGQAAKCEVAFLERWSFQQRWIRMLWECVVDSCVKEPLFCERLAKASRKTVQCGSKQLLKPCAWSLERDLCDWCFEDFIVWECEDFKDISSFFLGTCMSRRASWRIVRRRVVLLGEVVLALRSLLLSLWLMLPVEIMELMPGEAHSVSLQFCVWLEDSGKNWPDQKSTLWTSANIKPDRWIFSLKAL